jgi:hypothetical protein
MYRSPKYVLGFSQPAGWDEVRIPAQHRQNAGIRKLIPAYRLNLWADIAKIILPTTFQQRQLRQGIHIGKNLRRCTEIDLHGVVLC